MTQHFQWLALPLKAVFFHMWHMNQPTITGVALCHKKGWRH